MVGRRSRIEVDIDCSFLSRSLFKRIEKAINVSTGDLRSVVSSSVTNAERNLVEKNQNRYSISRGKNRGRTVENDVIPNTALLKERRVIYRRRDTFSVLD